MYQASSAFHQAVANGAPQKALLLFSDATFTNEDIDIDAGIELDDYFNTEEDIAIGQALSNELRFSLFNDGRFLNDYGFGEFTATIGARIQTGTYAVTFNARVTTPKATYIAYSSRPYVVRSGTAVSTQPIFQVISFIYRDGLVYAFGRNGQYAVYRDSDGANVTGENPVNSFMRYKGKTMVGVGFSYREDTRMYEIWDNGRYEKYECVPLGRFIAVRPNVPDVNLMAFTCHDLMTRFDRDMPTAEAMELTYPTTIGNLFSKICNYVGVVYATDTFINSTATITEEPEEFENATAREVMQWIAEAAAANLRISRDGLLTFDWLRYTEQELDENDYMEYAPYWYETEQVTKLYNRNTESGTDQTYGNGDVGYLIQDNPLLRGVT